MPTIDQLASATAASDTDTLVSSQNGVARKVTRAQIVAGLQPQLTVSSGSLLGRVSAGSGEPEPIGIGANLVLSRGTLAAAAAPFQVSQLPGGIVPRSGDLVPLAQGGNNVAVSYGQFLNGLGSVAGIDASAMQVSIDGGSQTLSDFAAASLSKAGGALTGPLTLPGDPSSPLQAATKHYVDAQTATALPISGGIVTGSISTTGSLQCGGILPASVGLVATSATLSGTLSVAGSAQLGVATINGALFANGAISAAGGFAGSTLNLTGGITAGGSTVIVGPLSVQGGATIRGGVVVLPQYSVAALPPASAGTLSYATNGRKPGELPGAGSGLLVWGTANQWLSSLSGAPVQA